MSKYFEQLSDVKANFQNNLQGQKEYSLSKGLLENFAKTFSEHKGLLFAMSAISLLGNIKHTNIENFISEPVAQHFDVKAYNDYKNGINISKDFTNVNYNENLQKLNLNSIDNILKNDSSHKDNVFINPFTDKNIITLKIEKENPIGSYTGINFDKAVELDLTKSLLVMDHSTHDVIIDKGQLKFIKDLGLSSSQEIVNQYVVMHEIAHTTIREAPAYNSKYDNQDRETHADLSSIMFVSKHSDNPLKTFNQLADDALMYRYMGLTLDGKYSDLGHNTIYPILELKNAINNNPELLNMKDTNITEFADKLIKNLSKKDYSLMAKSYFDKKGIEFTENSIVQDLRSGEPSTLVRYGFSKISSLGHNTQKINTVIEKSPANRANKIAKRIQSDFNGPQTYSNMVEYIFLSNKESDYKNVVDSLYKDVQKNSNLDSSFIRTAKQEVYFDSLSFGSGIKDQRLEELTKSANSYLGNKI